MIICIDCYEMWFSCSAGEECLFVDGENCVHTFYVQTSIILVEDDRGMYFP